MKHFLKLVYKIKYIIIHILNVLNTKISRTQDNLADIRSCNYYSQASVGEAV